MANVSKITKVHDDEGSAALSKIKSPGQSRLLNALRYRSTERAISRGRGAIHNRPAAIEANTYRNIHSLSNSQEDLKSHISKASFVKDLYQRNFQSLTPAKQAMLIQNMGGPSSQHQSSGVSGRN